MENLTTENLQTQNPSNDTSADEAQIRPLDITSDSEAPIKEDCSEESDKLESRNMRIMENPPTDRRRTLFTRLPVQCACPA